MNQSDSLKSLVTTISNAFGHILITHGCRECVFGFCFLKMNTYKDNCVYINICAGTAYTRNLFIKLKSYLKSFFPHALQFTKHYSIKSVTVLE